jgi:hypothetical protein
MDNMTFGQKALMKKLKASQKKNADARARKDVKPSSGTLNERAKKVAKQPPEKRGLPARIDRSLGNANKANPPKEIRLRGTGGTGRAVKADNFKPVPLRDKPLMISGPRGRTFNAGAAAGRLLGPVGALVGMTTPVGEGSDKPSGPLFSPSKNRAAGKGNPKAVNPYKSEPMSNADVQKAYQKINTGTKTDDPVTGVRRRIATPKARPADLNTSAKSKKKVEKRKPEKKSKTRIAFEKEFAAARKAGKKKFTSKIGKYGSYSTKLK